METQVLVKELGQALESWGREEEESQIKTPGGRIRVRWDEKGSARAVGIFCGVSGGDGAV
jgi:hypothetical protein